jgi:Uma2 family endonuclease
MHWSERQAPPNGYPPGSARPFTETDWHFKAMAHLTQALDDWYEAVPDAYVSAGLPVYCEKGNMRRRVAPDVFVVLGVPKLCRCNFLPWEEGCGLAVVIELTSSRTRWKDTHWKFKLYRDVLRVPEYFLFDPLRHHLDPPLQGYRLTGRDYRRMRPVNGRLRSRQLGLLLEANGAMLRLIDPNTGSRIPTWQELVEESDRLPSLRAEAERLWAENAARRRRPSGRNGH